MVLHDTILDPRKGLFTMPVIHKIALSDCKKAVEEHSSKASTLVRQNSIAGIAVIWLFNKGVSGHIVLSTVLIISGLCLLIALLLDFAMYVVASYKWRNIYNKAMQTNSGQIAATGTIGGLCVDVPHTVDIWHVVVFTAKIAFAFAGSMILVCYLVAQL